eukprot:PhF_6_TR25517/c0_g2_i1/m.35649
MDRAVDTTLHRKELVSPLQEQRDVGRIEPVLPLAGERPVDPMFPYRWDVKDLREYERTKHRMKRFTWQGSEANYMILIASNWDHQAEMCADDFKTFVGSVAKQFIEEKLVSIRSQLTSQIVLTPALKQAFEGYSDKEARHFVRLYLQSLETECSQALAKIDSQEWPIVKPLEPYIRMESFWSSMTMYGTFHEKESSTRKFEWRKFFRTVTMPMPFNETLFEKRLLDTRLWVHRECTLEYHTTIKRNMVLDFERFPVMHDPIQPPDHTYHRNFSFALDWKHPQPQLGGYGTEPKEPLLPADTIDVISARLGCTVEDLIKANPNLTDEMITNKEVKDVNVPSNALYKRPKSHPWLLPKAITDTIFQMTKHEAVKHKVTEDQVSSVPPVAEKYPFEWRYGADRVFPKPAAMVPGEESWQSYTKMFLDKELSVSEPTPMYNVNRHWPVQHIPGSVKDTPYEEDQTWMHQQAPIMKYEHFHGDAWVNDLPQINREVYNRSMEWQSP